jgi:hypothetical protein
MMMDGLISVLNNFKKIEFIILMKNLNTKVNMLIMILIEIMMVKDI